MKYRREVDGLRTLAVIPVILFHAGLPVLSGGFVGVDVFFVISGYLITSILIAENAKGRFSLVGFYERRARRLLPALFLVLFACLPAAWFWLLPHDLKSFAQSLIAVCLFSSNILFWRTSGYFEPESELAPLLHTWSLSVEEQYYLFFPVFLAVAWQLGRFKVKAILCAVTLGSLALAHWGALAMPAATFYLLPARTWELLLGALVAIFLENRSVADIGGKWNEAGGVAGLVLLGYANCFATTQTRFPNLYTLAPTLGAALIIMCSSPKTWVGRILGTRPMVGLGLISYSAYLWHQPLFAFARHVSLAAPSVAVMCLLSVLTLVLAYFTWRYVEAPFRDKARFSRESIFKGALLGLSLFLIIGIVGQAGGIKTQWEIRNPDFRNESAPGEAFRAENCVGLLPKIGGATCSVRGNGATRIVVWGDSHAAVLSQNIPEIPGTTTYVISHLGCPPLLGVRRYDGSSDAFNCDRIGVLDQYGAFVKSLNPSSVILVGRWSLYLNGWQRRGVVQRAHHHVTDRADVEQVPTPDERQALFQRQLRSTVNFLAEGSRVWLLSQPPDYAEGDYRLLERLDYRGTLAEVRRWHGSEAAVLEATASQTSATVIDARALFCDALVCKTRERGVLLYADDNHLSVKGSEEVWKAIQAELYKNLRTTDGKN